MTLMQKQILKKRRISKVHMRLLRSIMRLTRLRIHIVPNSLVPCSPPYSLPYRRRET